MANKTQKPELELSFDLVGELPISHKVKNPKYEAWISGAIAALEANKGGNIKLTANRTAKELYQAVSSRVKAYNTSHVGKPFYLAFKIRNDIHYLVSQSEAPVARVVVKKVVAKAVKKQKA